MSELNQPGAPALRLEDLQVHFGIGRRGKASGPGVVRAVDHVSLSVFPGETLGVVGESGSGKSTAARVAAGIQQPTDGSIWIGGERIESSQDRRSERRRAVQMVFQDPAGSLDQRQRIGSAIAEPLLIHRLRRRSDISARVDELLDLVGLDGGIKDRYPYQLSGGQRQRVAVARAMALEPKVIICDEPVSALDVSVQAQIVNQLVELQESSGVAYFFVAHDLAVVRHVAHRVAIMYRGRIVETGSTERVYENPRHPYTVALLSSVLDPSQAGRRAARIDTTSDSAEPMATGTGCHFRDRCSLYRQLNRPAICSQERPRPLPDASTGEHLSECHYSDDVPMLMAVGSGATGSQERE